MKVPQYRRITRADLGKEFPQWAETMLDALQSQLEKLTQAISNLTPGDNYGKVIQTYMIHGVAKSVNIEDFNPVGVEIGWVDGNYGFDAVTWRKIDNSHISVTVYFKTVPTPATTEVLVRMLVL